MLKGKIVNLYAVERSDINQLKEWRNNPDFRKYFREYRELSDEDQNNWYENEVISNPNTIMFSIRRKEDNILLGCCGFVFLKQIHRHADLSLYIGWNDAYIDNNGYAKEACKLLIHYGFNELSLNKIWTEIYEFDDKKNNLYLNHGFKEDGLLRQNYRYDGKWWNSRILSILASEFNR
jgi:RimJ/RimL family protein N-acetyltransferase